jgi:DNA-binding response OmpR family regulator
MMSESLRSCRILLVEDNALLANYLEETLRNAGAEVVGPAATLAAAEELAGGNGGISAALLDVRLHGGEEIWPAARLLAAKEVPFAFYTAHFDPMTLPAEWSGRPVITKPSTPDNVLAALVGLVGRP